MKTKLNYILTRSYTQFMTLCLFGLSLILTFSFLSYNPQDPSLSTIHSYDANLMIHNFFGKLGAYLSDFALQYIGTAAYFLVPFFLSWGYSQWQDLKGEEREKYFTKKNLFFLIASLFFLSIFLNPIEFSLLPHNLQNGGVIGNILFAEIIYQIQKINLNPHIIFLQIISLIIGLTFFIKSSAFTIKQWGHGALILINKIGQAFASAFDTSRPIKEKIYDGWDNLKDIWHNFKRQRPWIRDEDDNKSTASSPTSMPAKQTRKVQTTAPFSAAVEKPAPTFQKSFSFEADTDSPYELPPVDILQRPSAQKTNHLSEKELQEQASDLEKAFADFGVKGQINKISPGPVITLYEFEPAPGTKSSRITGLAEDIARTMGAVSVRIAVIPGENALGIEMPNDLRETVYMRELLESQEFHTSKHKLGLALGKNIAGLPIISDLAKMPHLLIAGTTGSGKSVGINTMILSLLYRHSPEKCRFIMIDPKMLELSVYDGIPHLLSPVVTDPKKAIMAVKWAVREMEDRYRAMSRVGVRNIEGYNQRLKEARDNNEVLTHRIQTGFDPDTGKPIFEEQPISLTELPYIVVIVDEMADLMLVAGKEIEAAIQRLAQMARAAGIHIIMATQRPSVDVITGTIKANFPTRISFHVTSKIDSRTILGEQGAEQLLGQGDMLYTAGGGRILRVHGPFATDKEVEEVVNFLKAQGTPDYDEAITEEQAPADGSGETSFADAIFSGFDSGNEEDNLYQKAVMIVKKERKASTSFIQRHLRIGYNRAASLVDRMESEGIISSANHVGKREVLISEEG